MSRNVTAVCSCRLGGRSPVGFSSSHFRLTGKNVSVHIISQLNRRERKIFHFFFSRLPKIFLFPSKSLFRSIVQFSSIITLLLFIEKITSIKTKKQNSLAITFFCAGGGGEEGKKNLRRRFTKLISRSWEKNQKGLLEIFRTYKK